MFFLSNIGGGVFFFDFMIKNIDKKRLLLSISFVNRKREGKSKYAVDVTAERVGSAGKKF